MEELHTIYQEITGQDNVPVVMELQHSNGDAARLDAFLDKHFHLHLDDVLLGTDALDGFFDIVNDRDGRDCRVLLVHHDDGQGVSRYFEDRHAADLFTTGVLRYIARRGKLDLHLKGADVMAVVRQLGPYMGTKRVLEITGKHPYGIVYSQDGYACIDVRVTNELGLHARPSAELVKQAIQYPATEIAIRKGSETVNGKSIMHVLMLATTKGTDLTVMAKGPKAEEAVSALYGVIGKINETSYETTSRSYAQAETALALQQQR